MSSQPHSPDSEMASQGDDRDAAVVDVITVPFTGGSTETATNTRAEAEDLSSSSSSSGESSDGTKSEDEMDLMATGRPNDVPRHTLDLSLIRARWQKLTANNRAEIPTLIPDQVDFRLRAGLHPLRHAPGMVVVHFDSVRAGLRFPLHSFFVSFFNFYEIVPAQVMPNSYQAMAGFICRCKDVGASPTLDLSHQFSKVAPQQTHGYLAASSRTGHILFKGNPTSIKGWKDRFFFVSVPDGLIPRKWNVFPRKTPDPVLSEEIYKDVLAVEKDKCYDIMTYLTPPDRLVKAGICTARSLGFTCFEKSSAMVRAVLPVRETFSFSFCFPRAKVCSVIIFSFVIF
ncbi:unnamed protein product [Cuscuta europaea]|uniref:Transposase (putative) gypsy type domain-containing protein n=1 Tax=Cuscuta europaea TaxID=41803 RepID=A0A9P1EJL6_CUSEU|nr:unnamed protein product [Cuscuta europaea]